MGNEQVGPAGTDSVPDDGMYVTWGARQETPFPTSAGTLEAMLGDHRAFPYTTSAKPVLSEAQVIAQLTKNAGYIWAGDALTYSFPTDMSWFPGGQKNGFTTLVPSQQTIAHEVMDFWDDVMSPDFTFVGNANNSTVKFSNTTTNIAYAHAYYPENNLYAGSIWLNPAYDSTKGTNNLIDPAYGAWGFKTYIHEAGHALGLSHPGAYNGSGFNYVTHAEYLQDTSMFTVMSYFNASFTGADFQASDGKSYHAQTPMMDDILAIQALYGVEAVRTGDTTYGFNSTLAGSVYDFNTNPHPFLCIYDTGGYDKLDLSGWNTNQFIDLGDGRFSDADGMTYNISIARGTVIEAAYAGGGDDFVSGNDVDNLLSGGGGDDALLGGNGSDQLYGGTGIDVLLGQDGADHLWGGADADELNGGTGNFIDYARYDDANHGNLTISLANPGINTGAANGDTYTSIEGLVGGVGNDLIYGDGNSNYLFGSNGGDSLWGGGGNVADHFYGGDDAGIDYARYDDGNYGNLTIRLDAPSANTGVAKGDTYNGIEGLVGGLGNDVVIGNASANYLFGGGGQDYIDGLGGNDYLNGGALADRFRMSTALNSSTNVDRIADFQPGVDKILLSQAIFAGIGATLDAGEFKIGSAADADDFILYNPGTGQLFYDAGGNTGAGPILFATVGIGTALNAGDFTMV